MTVAPTPVHHRVPRSRLLLGLVIGVALASIGAFLLVKYDAVGNSSSSGTLQGSGHAVSQVRTVPPFTRVELAGSNNVTISVGDRQRVVVHGDDNLVGHVTTEAQGGRLVIGSIPGSVATKAPASVTVTVPALEAITLSGSGTMRIAGVSGRELTVALPGSGTIAASGTVTRLGVTLDGSGQAELLGLSATDARASVGGSGTIMLTVLHRLDAAISGSGSIVYGGSPVHVSKTVSGSGAVVGG